jgi:protein-S-isoprenylcysteine O-methyltransferase Ste14
MYNGGVARGAVGWGCLNGSLVAILLSAVLLFVFYLKSVREEAWLVDHYAGYADYRGRTRRFYPGLF